MSDLSEASKRGDLATVQELIGEGANVNKACIAGTTPLWWASRNGHVEVVRVLLKKNAEVNNESNNGETPRKKNAKKTNK